MDMLQVVLFITIAPVMLVALGVVIVKLIERMKGDK